MNVAGEAYYCVSIITQYYQYKAFVPYCTSVVTFLNRYQFKETIRLFVNCMKPLLLQVITNEVYEISIKACVCVFESK